MSVSGKYFLPGPVEVDPAVMAAMQRPMIGHRGPAARALVAGLQPGLRALFGTERPVMLATGSATAMMEAGVRSGVRERILCVVSGTFGERFAHVAEHCGKDVVRLHVPHGDVLRPELLDQMLDGPVVDAVSLVHSETSTGAVASIAPLLARFRQLGDIVTLVDVVSSLGGMAIEADAWGADFVFSGSQKALGLPPGLAFAMASPRFVSRTSDVDDRGMYLDVIELLHAAEESRFPQTPALPIVYALEAQLTRIADEGLANRQARHRTMREHVEQWVARHERCGILAPEGQRADTVTALTMPAGRSAIAIAGELAQDGWQVAVGIGDDLDRLLRIGHMGDVSVAQLDRLLGAIEPLF